MKFNQSVDVNEVLTVLKDAAQQNKFGEYKVDSIKLSAPSSTVTPSTQGRVKCCLPITCFYNSLT